MQSTISIWFNGPFPVLITWDKILGRPAGSVYYGEYDPGYYSIDTENPDTKITLTGGPARFVLEAILQGLKTEGIV